MFLEITLIIFIIVGGISLKWLYFDDYPILYSTVATFVILAVIAFPFNTIEMFTAEYDYEQLEGKRNSYQYSLDNLREIDNSFETLAIGIEIIEFNNYIASEKVMNKSWFYDYYIDDRIETLQPVK